MSYDNIVSAKTRIEDALIALQGSDVAKEVGVKVTSALKVARARIDRLEALLEDKFTMRDKFAMNIVVQVMAQGTVDPTEALTRAYVLADQAIEVRR